MLKDLLLQAHRCVLRMWEISYSSVNHAVDAAARMAVRQSWIIIYTFFLKQNQCVNNDILVLVCFK